MNREPGKTPCANHNLTQIRIVIELHVSEAFRATQAEGPNEKPAPLSIDQLVEDVQFPSGAWPERVSYMTESADSL